MTLAHTSCSAEQRNEEGEVVMAATIANSHTNSLTHNVLDS